MSNPLGYNQSLVFRDDPVPGNWLQKITGGKFRLPKIFIAGAQKSGTTTLAAALAQHPEITEPQLKEPFYYGNDFRYSKGLTFYECNFPDKGGISFDASTNYLDHPLAATRIIKDVPDAKVILLLRNPVDRAFSHYKMQVRNKIEALSFEDALENEQARIEEGKQISPQHNYCYQRLGYRSRGEYHRMIGPWLDHFGADRLHIMCAEDFFREPESYFRQVLIFLELNTDVKTRIELLNAGEPSNMKEETRLQLQQHYADGNFRLEQLLNRSFNWNRT